MGQKVNPVGLRLGINRTWDSRWYSGKNEYGQLLHEDMKIRAELMKQLKQAAVSKIVIERPHKKCRVTIHSARPGVVIGKKGADIEKLRRKVAELTDSDVVINIVEIRKPELDAQLVAESIAQQLERRVAFRRAMKRAVQSAMRLGAGGILRSGVLNHVAGQGDDRVKAASFAVTLLDFDSRAPIGAVAAPRMLELARGKTGRVVGHLMSLLMLMKGQPLAYNKDNQEDKEPLFDPVDTLQDTLRVFAELVPGIGLNAAAMERARLYTPEARAREAAALPMAAIAGAAIAARQATFSASTPARATATPGRRPAATLICLATAVSSLTACRNRFKARVPPERMTSLFTRTCCSLPSLR